MHAACALALRPGTMCIACVTMTSFMELVAPFYKS